MNVHDAFLDTARRQLGLSVLELWTEYFALGGRIDANGLAAYLRAASDLSDTEHNVIAHALNERFQASGSDHPVAYFPT
ncbi:MAG: hypothetical protein ACR2HP_17830 [Ilumatobacteraceae bacterium]